MKSEIMESVLNIDETAMQGWLYQAHNRCMYHLQNEVDAQDISQSVIIELLLNYNTVKKPEAWLYQRRGYIGGRQLIAGEHFNKNILNFTDRFQWSCLHNNWKPLKRYLAPDVELPKNIDFPIYTRRSYKVIYLSDNNYKIYLIYKNGEKKSICYYYPIKIKPPYRIQITKFPSPVKNMYIIDRENVPEEIRETLAQSNKGSIRAKGPEIYELLKTKSIPIRKIRYGKETSK